MLAATGTSDHGRPLRQVAQAIAAPDAQGLRLLRLAIGLPGVFAGVASRGWGGRCETDEEGPACPAGRKTQVAWMYR